MELISALAVIYGLKQIAVEGLGWPSALTIGAIGLTDTACLVAFLLRGVPTTAEGGEHMEPKASEPSLDAAQAA